jgi:hypothetical protein
MLQEFIESRYPYIVGSWTIEVSTPSYWNNIIIDALNEIVLHDTRKQFRLDQIKEKFGGLRIYYHIDGANRALDKVVTREITKAELAIKDLEKQTKAKGFPNRKDNPAMGGE